MTRQVRGLCLLLALTGLATGCSQDRQLFRSTPYSPKTIALRDTVSHKVIWSKDVPVYHSLMVDLDRPGDFLPFKIGHLPADEMAWELSDDRSGKTIESGNETLPGIPVQLYMTLRDTPEYPPGYVPPADDVTARVSAGEPAPVAVVPPPAPPAEPEQAEMSEPVEDDMLDTLLDEPDDEAMEETEDPDTDAEE